MTRRPQPLETPELVVASSVSLPPPRSSTAQPHGTELGASLFWQRYYAPHLVAARGRLGAAAWAMGLAV